MDPKNEQRRVEQVVDVAIRRSTPYEFCVTAEPVQTGGSNASVHVVYQAEPEIDPLVIAQSVTVK
jgi:hypothetical protein